MTSKCMRSSDRGPGAIAIYWPLVALLWKSFDKLVLPRCFICATLATGQSLNGMRKVKVSVVTAVYNSVSTVAESVLSVRSQTHLDVEHIIIDGASTDGTLEILQSLLDKRCIFISERDDGIYDAMNKGVLQATGEIVCFLNADDIYANEHVLGRVAGLMATDGLDALFGDVIFFEPKHPEVSVRRYRSGQFRPDRIAFGWMPAHPALFVRRSVFSDAGLFRTDYKIAGDFEFVARAFGRGTLSYHYLPEILVRMRMGGISTSGIRSTILLNKEVRRACRENGISTNYAKILSKYPLKALEMLRNGN